MGGFTKDGSVMRPVHHGAYHLNYKQGLPLRCAVDHFSLAVVEFSAGNLYEQSVGEVWTDSPVFLPFRTHRKSAECLGCEHYRTRCVGGCPAVTHFRTGTLDACDPTCFTAAASEEVRR